MKKILLFCLIMISGCTSHEKEVYLNEYGNHIYEVRCDHLATCYQKAYAKCPNGIEKIDRIINPKSDTPIELLYGCN